MNSGHRTQLAMQIVHHHFGEISREIANALLRSDQPTLNYIFKTINESQTKQKKVTFLQVREALTVLLHHKCIRVQYLGDPSTEDTDKQSKKNGMSKEDTPVTNNDDKFKQIGLIYSINLEMIINRLRFAKLVQLIQRIYGIISACIIEQLVIHGRLRKKVIIRTVLESMISQNSEINDSIQKYQQIIHNAFEVLVQNRFIVSMIPLQIQKHQINDGTSTHGTSSSSSSSSNSNFVPMNTSLSASHSSTASTAQSLNQNGKKLNKNSAPPATSAANKKGVKRTHRGLSTNGRLENDGNNDLPMEMRLMMKQEPSSVPINVMPSLLDDEEWDDTNGSSTSKNTKRMKVAEIKHESIDTPNESDTVYWVIGWDQYFRCERHEAVIQFVTDRMEAMAGVVVKIILDHSLPFETSANQMKSRPMSVMDIYQRLHQIVHHFHSLSLVNASSSISKKDVTKCLDQFLRLGGMNSLKNASGGEGSTGASNIDMSYQPIGNINMNMIKSLLELLRLDSVGMVLKVIGSESNEREVEYMVNMESIIQILKQRTIQSIAIERFGPASSRILELLRLSKNKYQEQQQISDMVIIPARECRERLYRLYKDKWINYIEISKRGDFKSTSNHYFWYVDPNRLLEAIMDHLYHTVSNLKMRFDHEFDQGKIVLELSQDSSNDNIDEVNRYMKLVNKLDRLDHSILLVDSTLLVMEIF